MANVRLSLISAQRSADYLIEVLKQPLETAIAIHTEDFDDFHVQENMHVVISVKDFKAIVTHAETLKGSISAYFSLPTRPLQFSYQNHGIHCEFTLMTTGDFRSASLTPNPVFVSTRSSSRQPSVAPMQFASRTTSEMPPPARPIVNKPSSQRAGLRPFEKQPSISESDPDPESLSVPGDEADRTWDPPNYENQEEEEEMLGWDPNADAVSKRQSSALQSLTQGTGGCSLSYIPRQRLRCAYWTATPSSSDKREPRRPRANSTALAGMSSSEQDLLKEYTR